MCLRRTLYYNSLHYQIAVVNVLRVELVSSRDMFPLDLIDINGSLPVFDNEGVMNICGGAGKRTRHLSSFGRPLYTIVSICVFSNRISDDPLF